VTLARHGLPPTLQVAAIEMPVNRADHHPVVAGTGALLFHLICATIARQELNR
jgi:hypothetical protein